MAGRRTTQQTGEKSQPKTRPQGRDAAAFIASIPDEGQRRDATTLATVMERVTGSPPVMWGSNIVGFGSYHYRYASGREGDWFLAGFSPRSKSLTVYISDGFAEYGALLERLGKHSTGKSCLYIKRLADVDLAVLEEMLRKSAVATREASAPG
jgi:hypothetical protein